MEPLRSRSNFSYSSFNSSKLLARRIVLLRAARELRGGEEFGWVSAEAGMNRTDAPALMRTPFLSFPEDRGVPGDWVIGPVKAIEPPDVVPMFTELMLTEVVVFLLVEVERPADIPKFTEVPTLLMEAGLPVDVPIFTELPGVTDAPKFTELPGLADAPKFTELPGLDDAPKFTELPGLTGAPKFTELPGLAEAPEFTELPELAGAPKFTELPGLVGAPKFTELPGLLVEA